MRLVSTNYADSITDFILRQLSFPNFRKVFILKGEKFIDSSGLEKTYISFWSIIVTIWIVFELT